MRAVENDERLGVPFAVEPVDHREPVHNPLVIHVDFEVDRQRNSTSKSGSPDLSVGGAAG
jgi:hypothetical protein